MRKGRNRGAATGDAVKCRMCGRAVAVARDGRCPLGHFVGLPQPEAAAAPAPFPAAAGDAGSASAAAAPASPMVGTGTAAGSGSPSPASPAAAAAPQPAAWPAAEAATGPTPAPGDADLTSDLFADFGELGGFAGSAGLGPGDLDGLDSLDGTGGSEALDDLDGLDSLDGTGGALSDPTEAVETLDLLNWGAAASALDAELPVPVGDAVGAGPAVTTEEPATEVGVVEDEAALDAEDRRVARRRALGIVGGTIAAVATGVGSIRALPL